jgi:hypothetical protein
MGLRVFHFIFLYVISSTLVPVYLHLQKHGVVNLFQVLLAFFLGMNFIVCLWEIGLGLHITFIHKEYKRLEREYKKDNFAAVTAFFNAPLGLADIFSFKYWSSVWSTYSLYDPSYSNRESYGFFIDVGNGWSTILGTAYLMVAMTDSYGLSARTVGVIGTILYYQMFYGTVIYFLSFCFNERYKGKGLLEVALFVGLSNGMLSTQLLVSLAFIYSLTEVAFSFISIISPHSFLFPFFFLSFSFPSLCILSLYLTKRYNPLSCLSGIWFFLPLLGMYVSYAMIATDTFDIVR